MVQDGGVGGWGCDTEELVLFILHRNYITHGGGVMERVGSWTARLCF